MPPLIKVVKVIGWLPKEIRFRFWREEKTNSKLNKEPSPKPTNKNKLLLTLLLLLVVLLLFSALKLHNKIALGTISPPIISLQISFKVSTKNILTERSPHKPT